jgi:hypothetical protein
VNAYTGSVPDTRRRKPDWRTFAACRGHADAMFPDNDQVRIARARAICANCPVSKACLRDAINTGDNQWGVRAGLTPEERRSVKKEINRRLKAAAQAQQTAAPAKTAAPQRQQYSTLRGLFNNSTKLLIHGHLAWTGSNRPWFKGRPYSPRQVVFIVDRGREPVGRVLTTCGVSNCVLPEHIADDDERMECGSRPGYQRHLKRGETPCDRCRQANTDADNRLRRTGTSKVAA